MEGALAVLEQLRGVLEGPAEAKKDERMEETGPRLTVWERIARDEIG